MPNKITFSITTSDGKQHQTNEENIKKYGMSAYAADYPGATVRMRDEAGSDYDIPLQHYDDALAQGLHPFRTEHKQVATTTPQATTAKPAPASTPSNGGTPMSQADKARFTFGASNIVQQSAQGVQRAQNKIDFAKKNTGLQVKPVNLGENRSVTKTNRGTYVTESGNEYADRSGADLEQNAIDDYNYREQNQLTAELRDAYDERDRLAEQIDKRGNRIDGMALGMSPSGVPMGSLAKMSDNEYAQLQAAYNKANERITLLETKKNGGGFIKGFSDATVDPNTWLFGIPGILDAGKQYAVKRKLDNGGTLNEAETAMMEQTVKNNNAQSRYGNDMSFLYRAGQITAQALPFVVEFASTGGFSGVAKGVAKGTSAALGKMGGKYASTAAGKWIVKNTGVLAGDIASGFIMANTTGAAKTASDVLQRNMGDAVQYENGQYGFQDGKNLARSIYEAEVAQTLEYYTERLGEHLKLGKRLSKTAAKFGLSKLSKAINYLSGNKWLKMGGVHDYPSEVVEEEANIVLNSLLVGDNSLGDLVDGKTQADIVGGMFFSIGFMNVPRYAGIGQTAAQYQRYKHKTDNAAIVGKFRLGDEKWMPIQKRMDDATNDEMSDVITSIVNDGSLNQIEKKAALDYAKSLLTMRGYNMRLMAYAKDEADKDEEKEEKVVDHSQEQAYTNGYNAETAEAKQDIKNRLDMTAQRLADQEVGNKNDKTFEALLEEYTKNGEKEKAQVISDYLNAKQAYDGLLQRVRDDIDSRILSSDEAVALRVNRDDGMIHPASLKEKSDGGRGKDIRVYIIGGNVVMTEDGKMVDTHASDKTISIVYADTGEKGMIAPDAIFTVDEPLNAEEERKIAADNIREQYANEQAAIIDGKVAFNQGDIYTTLDENGESHRVTIVPNEQGITDNGDGSVNVTIDGVSTVMAKDYIQNGVDAANKARVESPEPSNSPSAQEEQNGRESAAVPSYAIGDSVSLTDADGETREVSIQRVDDDGVEVTDGDGVWMIPTDEFEEMLANSNTSQQTETASAQASGEGNATALPNIPKDRKGDPIFTATDADTAWDGLVEFMGSADDAQEYAKGMVAEKQKALERTQKVKTKTGVSPSEFRAAKKAQKDAVAQAQAELDSWTAIAGMQAKRTAEQKQAEQAAYDQKRAEEEAAIKAAKEKAEAERKEKEEAERKEREALQGVPDWSKDTPADARARGYRRADGHKYDRQEPIADKVEGKATETKFADGVKQQGQLSVIDASQLQPSHEGGHRNVLHFIDEAQPKERNDAASTTAADKIAANINPEEITSSVTAYTGAPTVNVRGEVIQGNNRSAALRQMWSGHQDQAQKYKQYLIDHAAEFGLDPEAVAQMESPVLVNMVDVDDATAIKLGQYKATDTESGGTERIEPKATVQKLGGDIKTFAARLLSASDEDASFSQLIDKNGVDVLKWMQRKGVISPTQYKSAFDTKGNLTAEAANDLKGIMYQSIFQGGSTQLEEMFNRMPAKAQRAILATAYRDYDSPEGERMVSDIQASIMAFNDLMQDEGFRTAGNYGDARRAVERWKRQYQFDDATGESYLPGDKYSNFALTLAAMYRGETQGYVQNVFNEMYDLVQGTKEADLFGEVDNTPRTLVEAVKQVLNIEYDGKQRSKDVGGRDAEGAAGRQASPSNTPTGERSESRSEAAAGGRGTEEVREEGGTEGTAASGDAGRPSQDNQGKPQGQRYTLSTEKAGNGEPFYQDENGNIDLVTVAKAVFDKIGYSQAPFRLTPSMIEHMLGSHAKELGFSTVDEAVDFVLDVMHNFDHVRLGYDGALIFSVENGRNRTGKRAITILINSDSGQFYGLKTSGYEAIKGLEKRPLLWERGAKVSSSTDAASASVPTSKSSISGEQSGSASNQSNASSSEETTPTNSRTDVDSNLDGKSDDTVTRQSEDVSSVGKDSNTSDIKQGKEEKSEENSSTQAAVEAAEQEVDTHPTDAQKEAGNYKKGHVEVAGFDITIENPKGSERSGTDADGKKWSITMQNTYGYIRGTEGVDGDHIDVFLADDIDAWDSSKVYVVDQYNTDGTFDEHKVMLGFNDTNSAYNAYLSNYSDGWEKGRKLHVSEVSFDDFKKWVDSSHRKTKPFAEYKSVQKATEQPQQETEKGASKIEYTIEPTQYTTKRGKVLDMQFVQFDFDDPERFQEQLKAAKAYAKELKGWWDSKRSGFLMRSVEDAQALVDAVNEESGETLADHAPLSLADLKESTPQSSSVEETNASVYNMGALPEYLRAVDEGERKLQSVDEFMEYNRWALAHTNHPNAKDVPALVKLVQRILQKGRDYDKRKTPIGSTEERAEVRGIYASEKKLLEHYRGKGSAIFIDDDAKCVYTVDYRPAEYKGRPDIVIVRKEYFEGKGKDNVPANEGIFEMAERIANEEEAKRKEQSKALETAVTDFVERLAADPVVVGTIKRDGKDSALANLVYDNVQGFLTEDPNRYVENGVLKVFSKHPELFRRIEQSVRERVEEAGNEPKPIGKGAFGNIYDQFKGKVKAAIEFLTKKQDGEALGVLHHADVGDISLVWGNAKAGLQKIAQKHPEVLDNLQQVLDGMHITKTSDNRIKLESDTHFAVVSREWLGEKRTPWLLTAYEKKESSATNNTMDTADTSKGKRNDTATPQDTASADKGTEKSETQQGNSEKKEQPKQEEKQAKSKWVNDEDADRFEELRKRLRQKLRGQMNMGVDPEIFAIGVEMSYLMLKKGARKFGEFAKNLVDALGEEVRPYIKAFYNGARDLPEMADYEKDMTPYEEVRKFDVMNFDKKGAKDIVATAEHITRELEVEKQAEEGKEKLVEQRNNERREANGIKLRPATDEDIRNSNHAYYKGKRVGIAMIVEHGEQANAVAFRKPVITSVYLGNGQEVKVSDLMVEDAPAPKEEKTTKPVEKTATKKSTSKKKSVSSQAEQPSLFDDLNTNDNEQVHLQNGRTTAERDERHSAQPHEPLGESQQHANEQTDTKRVGGRSQSHTWDAGTRSGSVSGTSGEREHVAQAKNTRNNHGERGAEYAPKSVDARIEANIKAIELAQHLLENGEQATPQQMAVLRKFSGWGGLGKAFQSTRSPWSGERLSETAQRIQNILGAEAYEQAAMSANSSFYTPTVVIDTLWDIAKKVGFKGGKILEGSAGIGNILAQMPTEISERSDIEAVEIDQTAGGILSLLYPDAKVQIQGFEQTKIKNNSVDLAITNVPFVTGLRVSDNTGDQDLAKKFHDIHDFCIAKNVRKLREGGIGIFITSNGTLDSSQKLRNWLVSEGNTDVVGAFRLNNKTFGGTSVTSDIIVIRKRVNGQQSPNAIDVSTVSAERTSTYHDKTGIVVRGGRITNNGEEKTVTMDYNRYFMEHPEMMAGEMFFGFEKGDTYRPTSKGLYPVAGKEQDKMLADFVNTLAPFSDIPSTERTVEDNRYAELGESVKEGSMIVNGGRLCIAQGGMAIPLLVNANKVKGHTKVECFEAYSAIKDAVNAVLDYQTLNADDAGLKPLLKNLNKTYDDFVNTYGRLHKNTAISFLKNDIEFPSIAALEKFAETGDKQGNRVQTFEKTDIFKQRVVEKHAEPHPTNVKDGVVVSIQQHGRIDIPYIAEQIGKGEEDVKQEIVKSGLGFENPVSGEVEVSYQYLSGNVREKLRQAQENNESGQYDPNIKALKKVMPMDIPAHLIEFTLGSSWVSPKLYEDYVKARTGLNVKLTLAGGQWHMDEPYVTNNEQNKAMSVRSEMLRKTIFGHVLIAAAIQNKTIIVQETHKTYDGGKETITDRDATAACAAKVDEIRQDFKEWARQKMQSDPELSAVIERTYNEMFNNYVPLTIPQEFIPKYFDGASHRFDLRPHQGAAAVRATMQPLMLAHEVGTGKTFTLITTAMEMRRLGTAKKPMIVVQNATVAQFVADAKALYPNAKVLTLSEKDRKKEGRKDFYAKIRYNDWDMIVVPQSTLDMIPDSEERQMAYIQDKIDEKLLVLQQMKEAGVKNNDYITKQAEREIAELQDQLSAIASGEEYTPKKKGKKGKSMKDEAKTRQNAAVKAQEMLDRKTDDTLNFDEMGIDALLVDEAHEYKHLGFATAMQRGVKGVDPSYSKKSQGVFLKCQAVLEKSHGKNVVFATGTPISNTAAEVWTFMRYLMPADTMKEYGIYYFDDFVRNFGSIQQIPEFGASGKFKEVNRFAGYNNLPELERIWLSVADTVKTEDNKELLAKIPEMEGGKAQDLYLPQTKALRSVMKYVKQQLEVYEKMSGKEKKANSHIPLTMYGIAKAAAVDARLVLNDAADEQNSKTNEAVRQTLRTLKDTADYKGTVAIFADNYQNKVSGFNLYEDIRRKLIAKGVPAEQIAIIKSGMTINKKQEIFDKVNSGEIRVVMGSTFTLGTGVNIQERLNTLIHVDAPNRPMDYTQRNGRILRQGNLHKQWNKPVRVLRFGVEDSLDVTAYQRLKTKGAIADSIMNGKKLLENSMTNRVMEEEEDVFGDTVAQLSGSEYAMLKNQMEKEVRKLESRKKQFEADQIYIHNAEPRLRSQIKTEESMAKESQAMLDKVRQQFPDGKFKSLQVGKNTFGSIEDMADFFKEYNKGIKEAQDKVRDTVGNTTQTRSLTLNLDGLNFDITTTIAKGTDRNGATLFSTATRKMFYSCQELGLENVPVSNGYLKNAVEDIINNVITGNDFAERAERMTASAERNKGELEVILKRKGGTFEEEDKLRQAKDKWDEYTEKMKEELAAKEAKYAEIDAEVETATDVVEAEEDSEEANEAAREQRVDEDAVGELTEDEIAIRDAISDHLNSNGIETIIDDVAGQRVMDLGRSVQLSKGQKRALETATLIPEGKADLTVVSSADGAKILQKIDAAIKKYEEKLSNRSKTFIGDVANALEMTSDGSASQYATFETKNGKTVTIRMGNHNATVKNFDVRGESDGISIVIAQYANEGITNNGVAHLVEFYYSEKALRRADGKPLVEILKSIKQSLYSGEYNDTTGLAEREEVNAERIREQRVYHGSAADFTEFDHSHMGEGEGAQAYGWGTYVTEIEGIGRTYAEQISESKNGTDLDVAQNDIEDCEGRIEFAQDAINDLTGSAAEVEKAFNDYIRNYADFFDMPEGAFKNAETLKKYLQREIEKDERRKSRLENYIKENKKTPNLYTVEIPNETENFYLNHTQRMSEQQDILDMADNALTNSGWHRVEVDGMVRLTKGDKTVILNPRATGADFYDELSEALGSPKSASEFLYESGIVGIEYPAQHQSGGREDNAKNYVIFNEKDLKITDHVRFFKTPNGEAYGFTVGGKIYIDPRIATAETPIHEYAHLWAEALRQGNPKEWQNVVELMKGTSAWDKVRQKYPELKSDNEITDEVLAHYSGQRGAERLRAEQRRIAQSNIGILDKAAAIGALENVKQALKKFWKAVADFLHIHYTSAEEVADRVLSDLLNGVNPTTFAQEQLRKRDEEYIKAVEAGDKKKVRNMVLEAAKETMPNTKVVDRWGRPKVVYHGTPNEAFTTFKDGEIFFSSSRGVGDEYRHRRNGFGASMFPTGHNMPCFINLENPLEIDAHGRQWDNLSVGWTDERVNTHDVAKYAKENGYDGVIIKNVKDGVLIYPNDPGATDYIAFDPSQVKSAGPTYGQGTNKWDKESLLNEVGATYDNNGNLIPLSERFNFRSNDIRYQKSSAEENQSEKIRRIIPDDVEKSVSLRIEKEFDDKVQKILPDALSKRYWQLELGALVDDFSKMPSSKIQDILDDYDFKTNGRRKETASLADAQSTRLDDIEIQHQLARVAADRELNYRQVRRNRLESDFGIRAGQRIGYEDLERIYRQSEGGRDRNLESLYLRASSICRRLGVGVGASLESNKLGSASIYRKISLFLDNLVKTSETAIELPVTIVHEMLHQGTMGAISLVKKGKAEGVLTPKQIEGVNEILAIYESVKDDKARFQESDYGLKDAYEFAAQMADPRQRRALDLDVWQRVTNAARELLRNGDASLWQRLKNAVSKLFELSDRAKMDKALNKIMDDFNEVAHDIAMNDIEEGKFGYKVTDKKELDRLNSEDTFKMYSTVQEVDGVWASPMAGYEGESKKQLKLTNTITLHDWYRSDETELNFTTEQRAKMDALDKSGKSGQVVLVKRKLRYFKGSPNGKGTLQFWLQKTPDSSLWANYNPYNHTSTSMMNDQFTGAYGRSVEGNKLVVAEWDIPTSEKTSGYQAPMAHDAEGFRPWHSGVVNALLPEDRQRSVMLSRHRRMSRIVPYAEQAKSIADQLKGTGLAIPWNTHPYQVIEELAKLGVPITTIPSGTVKAEHVEAFNKQKAELEKKYPQARFVNVRMTQDDYEVWGKDGGTQYREGSGALNDEQLSYENDPMAKMGVERTRKQQREFAERERERKNMATAVNDLAEKLHLDNVAIVTPNDLRSNGERFTEMQRKAKGFFNPQTGKITIMLGNHRSVDDAVRTLLHEAVGHYGLRQLFGTQFDTFLDNVYQAAEGRIVEKIDEIAEILRAKEVTRLTKQKGGGIFAEAEAITEVDAKRGQLLRRATEEYLARLAENTDFERAMEGGANSWWMKIKERFLQMLHAIGFKNYADKVFGNWLTDNELRYLLWRSYENLAEPGRYRSILGKAADIAKQYELKVGNYAKGESEEWQVAEPLATTSARFDEELQQQIDGTQEKNHIYQLGMPSSILRSTGIPRLPIQLNSTKLKDKATLFNHDYDLQDVKGLVDAIQHPLAIFAYGNKEKAQNLIVKLQKDGKNFIVGLSLNPIVNGKALEINSVRNVFQKDNAEWLHWIEQNKALYLDKEKIQALIAQQRTNLADVNYLDLDSVAKIVNDFVNPSIEGENVSEENVLFRDDDDYTIRKVQARDAYERRVRSGWYQSVEAMQDSMLGLKEGMNAILKAEHKKMYIEDVAGFENAYLGENRLSSVNQAEMEAAARLLFKPLYKAIGKLAKTDEERQEVMDYMMAKHGLERNEVMARRPAERQAMEEFKDELRKAERAVKQDAANDLAVEALEEVKQRIHDREEELYFENRSRDYAGLTMLFSENGVDPIESVAEAEAKAREMVANYEQRHDTTELWQRINAISDMTLSKSYESGLMSKATYEDIKGMYDYYIPLRGFDEKTSADAYAYLTHRSSAFNAPIKTAKGRKSKADNPLAYLQSMVESGIMQGNRNVLVKQRFMNFVINHPSDLVSVSDLWLEYDEKTDEWVPVFNDDIKDDDTPAEVERKMAEFEERMRKLEKENPEKYKHGKETANVPYRVVEKSDLRQHQVLVKRGGVDHVLTINGNPRMAQALNGQTNPNNDQTGDLGKLLQLAEKVNRQLSAFYTTRNPDFVVSNFTRDLLYANTMTWVKESPSYALRFHRNYAKVNPFVLGWLLHKYENNTLDMNDEMQKMFYQFMMNGGETGYTSLRDIEQHKKGVKKELKRAAKKISADKTMAYVGDFFDDINRSVENCARFAAFVTSRQVGRTIDRSIWDAKEISVNFNKKGSGSKFIDANGQTKLGKTAAFASGYGRSFLIFWNAAIQGTTNFGKQAYRHPVKALAGAATMYLMGALAAAMGMGDDDDKNAYYNLPEYVRRSNIMFRAFGDGWVSIPLPVEYRVFYGMGELAASVICGKEHLTSGEIAMAMASQLSQALPLDFLEGQGGLNTIIPSAAKPLWEAYVTETSWTGMPLYKDTPYNKEMPEWTKAYKSANKYIVGLSEALNEATGGSPYKKGLIDFNPAKFEYWLTSRFGGVTTTIDKLLKSAETVLGEREYDPRSFLIVNRFYKNGDERTEYRAVNNEYFRLKEEAESTKMQLKGYENDTDNGIFDYSEKIDALYSSPEYERMLIFDDYKAEIKALGDELKEAQDDNERKMLEDELNELKKEMISEMEWTREKPQKKAQ